VDFWLITTGTTLALIIGLAVVMVWINIKEKRSGYPREDERTQRITGKAATYSLYIGMYFTIALLFANIISKEFYGSYFVSEGYALIASLLPYSVSFIVLRLLFNRRGEA